MRYLTPEQIELLNKFANKPHHWYAFGKEAVTTLAIAKSLVSVRFVRHRIKNSRLRVGSKKRWHKQYNITNKGLNYLLALPKD